MRGFNYKGTPAEFQDFYNVCLKQQVPSSRGKTTYLEAVKEAFPEVSLTQINRLFKDKSVKVYGYVAEANENPEELFGGSFEFAVFRAGKTRGVFFK